MIKYGWNLKRNRREYRFCDVITLMINIKKTKISHYDLWLVMILISVRHRPSSESWTAVRTVWIDRRCVDVCESERFDQSKLKKEPGWHLKCSRISSRTFSGFYRLTLRSHNKKKTGLNKLTFDLFWPRKFDFKGHSTMHRIAVIHVSV